MTRAEYNKARADAGRRYQAELRKIEKEFRQAEYKRIKREFFECFNEK